MGGNRGNDIRMLDTRQFNRHNLAESIELNKGGL